MSDLEIMQMALDALEGYARNCRCEGGGAPCDAAEAIRARLTMPKMKPVAWRNKDEKGRWRYKEIPILLNGEPLYTHPNYLDGKDWNYDPKNGRPLKEW